MTTPRFGSITAIGAGMGMFGMVLLIGGSIWLTVAGREQKEWT